jgi:mannose-6-phosphate isomerase
MSNLPLLRFRPILREYVWGGRRLAELGKPIGKGDHYAESWEIVDHGADQSIVAGGPMAGTSLHDIVVQHGSDLFGRHQPQRQFPLLLKFLDCHQTLSVQVHPNDEQAAKLDPPDLGKTEAWVVLAAERGSRIYAGLKPGVDRAALERELARGTCETCLHSFEPKVGDCVLIEAGTVHALGAGLLIAEIQQASDTTFRLFDWNRVGIDGKPRPLHIQQALNVIDFSRGPVNPVERLPRNGEGIHNRIESDKFTLTCFQLTDAKRYGNTAQFHILAVLEGQVAVCCDRSCGDLTKGDTVLVPAFCDSFELQVKGSARILEANLP